VLKTVSGTGSPPNLTASKLAELKKNKQKHPAISIEKRMPINIFNIKNVNYLNGENSHHGKSLFRNEVLRENTIESCDVFEGEHTKSTGKVVSKKLRTRSKSNPKNKHRKGNSLIDVSSHLLNKEATMTLDARRVRPKTPNPDNLDYRKRSADSKSLITMMAQVNKLKHKDEGIRMLFQKISKTSNKDTQLSPYISIMDSIKNKFAKQEFGRSSHLQSKLIQLESADQRKTKLDKQELSAFNETEQVFKFRADKFTEQLESTIDEYLNKEKSKPKLVSKACQAEQKKPVQIPFANINTPNLIKEHSRCFMLSKKTVNPSNENASGFFQRIKPVDRLADRQKARVYRELFSLAQEHALVEESLRLLQEKGFDLEVLFAAAYDRLQIRGNENKLNSARDSVIPDECADVSGVSIDSTEQSRNIDRTQAFKYKLQFDLLNRSITED
jgi:hypothetical protein